jgi:hypothetical protein
MPGLRKTDQVGGAGSRREDGTIGYHGWEPSRPCRGASKKSTSRVDGDDGCPAVEESSRGDPRAGANIEYHQPMEDPESVVDPIGVGRSGRVVLVCHDLERRHRMILTDPGPSSDGNAGTSCAVLAPCDGTDQALQGSEPTTGEGQDTGASLSPGERIWSGLRVPTSEEVGE